MLEIPLGPMDADALGTFLREQVLQRRAFLPGVRGIQPQTPCALVVALPSGTLRLAGEVVFACADGPGCGVGLQLEPLPAPARAAIDALLQAAVDGPAPEPPENMETEPDARPPAEKEVEAPPESQALHVRLRSLSGAEQRRIAASGNLAERVLLERLYGPNVWETLLSSGRLTLPEVATIARKGTVPKPLLELIGASAGYLASEQVQRALLANPRSSGTLVKKVLRMLPRHELARVPHQTAYPMSVRQAAVALLKPERG